MKLNVEYRRFGFFDKDNPECILIANNMLEALGVGSAKLTDEYSGQVLFDRHVFYYDKKDYILMIGNGYKGEERELGREFDKYIEEGKIIKTKNGYVELDVA